MRSKDRTREPSVTAGGTNLNRFRHVDAAAEGATQGRGDGNVHLGGAPEGKEADRTAPGRQAPGRAGQVPGRAGQGRAGADR